MDPLGVFVATELWESYRFDFGVLTVSEAVSPPKKKSSKPVSSFAMLFCVRDFFCSCVLGVWAQKPINARHHKKCTKRLGYFPHRGDLCRNSAEVAVKLAFVLHKRTAHGANWRGSAVSPSRHSTASPDKVFIRPATKVLDHITAHIELAYI